MKKGNKLSQQQNQFSALKPMLIGAVIGFLLISFFVFGVDQPKPEWGKLWRLRPLTIAPLAGAMGGLFYYFMRIYSAKGMINKTLAIVLSALVFIIGLFMGVVLGLDGTMWD